MSDQLPVPISQVEVDSEEWLLIPQKGMEGNTSQWVGRLTLSNGKRSFSTAYEQFLGEVESYRWGNVYLLPMELRPFVIVGYWYLVEWPTPTEPKIEILDETIFDMRGVLFQIHKMKGATVR